MKLPLIAASMLPLSSLGASFNNLGFDNPEYPVGVPNPIPHTTFSHDVGEWVRPGWTSSPQSAVGFNYTQAFEGWSSLLDVNYRNTTQPANPTKVPVVDNYALGIWPPSRPGGDGVTPGFVLKQTGDIPAAAQSLRFLYAGSGDFKVFVGGAERLVHFTESVASSDPEVGAVDYYVVDVGLFAGQTAELRFEFFSFGNYPGDPSGSVPGRPDAKFHVLDDLSFSPLPAVPEPQTWALLGTGMVTLLWFSRRK